MGTLPGVDGEEAPVVGQCTFHEGGDRSSEDKRSKHHEDSHVDSKKDAWDCVSG